MVGSFWFLVCQDTRKGAAAVVYLITCSLSNIRCHESSIS
jgi:hypothetical protein